MIKTYSLHKIDDRENLSFSKEEYSRFKFGDGTIGAKFGNDLAKGFINECERNELFLHNLVVFTSPYMYIPTATYCLKDAFFNELNKWRLENKLEKAVEGKIYRTTTYTEDYGALSAEDRIGLIGNDSFVIDEKTIVGKTLIFLDDIKITGSHEKMILKTINGINDNAYLIYFAELVNKQIDPTIENELNYAFVNNIIKLDEIIFQSDFKINTRFVKYLLGCDINEFATFLKNKTTNFLENLYFNAVGNQYHKIKKYSLNFELLKNNLTLD